MVWTAPNTAVAGQVWTAADFNLYVRDNLLQTGPALHGVNTNGYFTQRGDNDVFPARMVASGVDTSATTITSTTYADSAPPGPSVTVTTDTSAAVFMSAAMADEAAMSFAVSGATTIAASDSFWILRTHYNPGAIAGDRGTAFRIVVLNNLTAGSNTFTAKYRRVTTIGGSTSFSSRYIGVMPL